MPDSAAALIAISGFEKVPADEFNDWLDTEHIPKRLALPGFLRAERWLAEDGSPTSIVLYELSALDVLDSEAYRNVTGHRLSPWSKRLLGRCKRIRFDAELTMQKDKPGRVEAKALLLVAMNVAPDTESEFNRWYDGEHIPSLFALDGVLGVRRYRAARGEQRYVAVYHLESPDVQGSPAWKKAIDTPWASRVRPHTRDRVRFVCRRYVRAQSST